MSTPTHSHSNSSESPQPQPQTQSDSSASQLQHQHQTQTHLNQPQSQHQAQAAAASQTVPLTLNSIRSVSVIESTKLLKAEKNDRSTPAAAADSTPPAAVAVSVPHSPPPQFMTSIGVPVASLVDSVPARVNRGSKENSNGKRKFQQNESRGIEGHNQSHNQNQNGSGQNHSHIHSASEIGSSNKRVFESSSTKLNESANNSNSSNPADNSEPEQNQNQPNAAFSSSSSAHNSSKRHLKSADQIRVLKEFYSKSQRATKDQVWELINLTGLNHREVTRWFRNERHKQKKTKFSSEFVAPHYFHFGDQHAFGFGQQQLMGPQFGQNQMWSAAPQHQLMQQFGINNHMGMNIPQFPPPMGGIDFSSPPNFNFNAAARQSNGNEFIMQQQQQQQQMQQQQNQQNSFQSFITGVPAISIPPNFHNQMPVTGQQSHHLGYTQIMQNSPAANMPQMQFQRAQQQQQQMQMQPMMNQPTHNPGQQQQQQRQNLMQQQMLTQQQLQQQHYQYQHPNPHPILNPNTNPVQAPAPVPHPLHQQQAASPKP